MSYHGAPMNQPSPAHEAVADELISAVRAAAPDTSCTDASERVLALLSHQVGLMVGREGFRMLVSRSVVRACSRHPLLMVVPSISPGRLDGPFLSGLDDAAGGAGADQVHQAARAVIAELLGLLARFLGEDIAMRMVGQSFPDASPFRYPDSEDTAK